MVNDYLHSMIRQATIKDILKISDFWQAMMIESGLVRENEILDGEQFILETILNLKKPEHRIFISDHGFISGYVTQLDHIHKLTGVCNYIYVEPDKRNELTDKFIERLHVFFKGCEVLDERFITNYSDTLIRFWEKKGFEPSRIIFSREV